MKEIFQNFWIYEEFLNSVSHSQNAYLTQEYKRLSKFH